MTNHVHLLATPGDRESISRMMQYVGRRYVVYVYRAYVRGGTLWEGRFRCSLVDDKGHLLACARYIELDPVRAGMVASAADYPWSSHRVNGMGAFFNALTFYAF